MLKSIRFDIHSIRIAGLNFKLKLLWNNNSQKFDTIEQMKKKCKKKKIRAIRKKYPTKKTWTPDFYKFYLDSSQA